MRVLFLTVRSDLGGGPEHLYQLLKNRTDGVEAFVACPDERPYRERYEALLGRTNVIDLPHRAFSPKALLQTARFIRAQNIDVLHSHGKGAGLYARLLGMLTRRPVVHTFHGLHVGEYSPVKKKIYLELERLLGWMTRSAICVSEGEAKLVRDAGFIDPSKLVVIDNGIAIPEQITRPQWTGGPLRLLAVNRYDHQKNPDLLVEIAQKLSGQIAFHLDVIGTGERLEEMKARVSALGLDESVTLHGGVPNPRDYLQQAHVFVSTSRWEGMPLAVLEAMSEGLCVVATDVVGNADVIRSNENGLLFQTAHEALEVLQTLTPEQFETLTEQAALDAKAKYSASVMAQATFGVLAACLKT